MAIDLFPLFYLLAICTSEGFSVVMAFVLVLLTILMMTTKVVKILR